MREPHLALRALLLAFLLAAPSRSPALEDPPAPAAPAKVAPPAPGHPWKEASRGKGRLEVLPSGLAVLHLEGTPEEMGDQHGALLGEEVRGLVKDYLPKVLRGPREAALLKARALEKQIPGRHLREMRALAAAAGVTYDDVLLGSVVVELFGLHGCSAAAASGPASSDGRTVVGRNLEWPDHGVLGRYGLVIAAKPEGLRPFLSLGFPALTGVVTGMNGDGVFTAELVAMNGAGAGREEVLRGVPWPVLLRRLLEECGTLEEAARLVRSSPLTVPQNLLLADPRAGLVLECAAGRCADRPQEDGLVVVTNFWGEREEPQDFDPRYRGLCDAFRATGEAKVDGDSMEKAIRAASSRLPASAMNLQCGVFFPATLRARVALGRPPASNRPFAEIDGAALLGVAAPADRKGADSSPPAGGGR